MNIRINRLNHVLKPLSVIAGLCLCTMLLSACSDGFSGAGDETAGIGGSGYISTGTVTSFGSVFVNGVEFETTESTVFDVEDVIGAQTDLRIGMVVQVRGTINSDHITGDATHIEYRDALEGPISAIVTNADVTEHRLTILGVEVIVSSANSIFAGDGFSFATLAVDNVIEVSGYYNQAEQLVASYIELKSTTSNASTEIEITGVIMDLTGTRFTVRGIAVEAVSARLDGLDSLQDNILVEVKGVFDSATNTLIAAEVERESDELSEIGEVEVQGLITRYVSNNDFDINGITVNARDAQFSPTGLMLAEGMQIEVEGRFSNGVLVAREVELRGGNVEISAPLNAVDLDNNRITLEPIPGQFIIVQLTTATRMEDSMGSDNILTLLELSLDIGAFIEVRGFETGTNMIEATQIQREEEEGEVELQGVVQAQVLDTSITVLGIEFLINVTEPNATQFEGEDEANIASHNDFISAVVLGQSIVSIVDSVEFDGNALGTADEIEIERL